MQVKHAESQIITQMFSGTLYWLGGDLEKPCVLLWDLEFGRNKFIKLKGINLAGSRPYMRIIAKRITRILGGAGGEYKGHRRL